jgi:hypothetical protein
MAAREIVSKTSHDTGERARSWPVGLCRSILLLFLSWRAYASVRPYLRLWSRRPSKVALAASLWAISLSVGSEKPRLHQLPRQTTLQKDRRSWLVPCRCFQSVESCSMISRHKLGRALGRCLDQYQASESGGNLGSCLSHRPTMTPLGLCKRAGN